ncbi:PAS domain-containing hybrid sensor histidine kinase/response regulator [Dechloromonas sp.]|uniref:PAS domain-containing hybrid sensor histidine kinase/response regulator n=1 Tax=Dechloromonas sp. TaxID=1917218 RepID=UPI00286E6815|nr:response regulator [Dechloromonas sp.]
MSFETQSESFRATLHSAILNEAPDGILVVTQENTVASVNERFFSVWNIPCPASPLDALIGTSDTLILEQVLAQVRDSEPFLARIRTLYADPSLKDDCNIPLKDGRTLQRHSAALRGDDGRYMGRVWFFRDISDIVRSQQAREDSERRYATAFETTPDAIAITSLQDGIYIDVNQAFLDMSGYTRQELIGHSSLALSIWADPQDRENFSQKLREKKSRLNFEARFRKKCGELFWGMFSVSPMSFNGQPCLLSITRDVTQAKAAQDELASHRDRLEQLVAERTAELSRAKEAAETASIAKSAFLANMSHEIRTPLNAVTGMAHLIRRGGLTPTQVGQLDKLENAGQHLLSIINAILELSKIEAGKLILAETPVHIGQILDNVLAMLQTAAQAKHLNLASETENLPPNLLGDPTALHQALLNYAANAVKFTDVGKVKLRVGLLADEEESVVLRFEVEDSGIGIPAEAMPRLFSAFEQADNTLTRKYGGTGLGLAITRKLAEHMGGTAGASSTPGQGSTFWFTARLKKGSQALPNIPDVTPSDPETRLARDYSGRRILLVEDEPINREIAEQILAEAGLSIETAEDGEQAVDLVRRNNYDLILMDVQMPTLDGLAATRLIRTLPKGRQVPVIAMTANAYAEDRALCLTAGMNDFISKPASPELLFATVLDWLEKADPELRAGSELGCEGN